MLLKNKWIIIMIWLTVLVVFGVWQIDNAVRYSASGLQTVDFGNSPIPVNVTNPGNENIYVIPMGNNTAWIIDRVAGTVQVITRDKSGQFHSSGLNPYRSK